MAQRIVRDLNNLKLFQKNIFGNLVTEDAFYNENSVSFIRISDDYCTIGDASGPWECPAGHPYYLSLEQMCNTKLFIEPDSMNREAWGFNGTWPAGSENNRFNPDKKKTYWIWAPQLPVFSPYVGMNSEIPGVDASAVQLFQSWKSTFGFDKIPIGFGVGFSINLHPGTEIAILVGNYQGENTRWEYDASSCFTFTRMTPANYLDCNPYLVNTASSTRTNPYRFGPANYKFNFLVEADAQAYVYEESWDDWFQTHYPVEYNTKAKDIVGPIIRPNN